MARRRQVFLTPPGPFKGRQPRTAEPFGVSVDVEGAVDALTQWRQDVAAELAPAYQEIAQKVERLARPNVPVGVGTKNPGALRDDLRATATEKATTIRVGRARVPYAGPVHWGWQQPGKHSSRNNQVWNKGPYKPGSKFIWLVVYPTDSSEDGPAEWIAKIITEAVDRATEKFDRKQKKATKGIALR